MCLNPTQQYYGHLCTIDFFGIWLGMDLRMDDKNTCVHKRLGSVLQKHLTILGSIINTSIGGPISPLHEHVNLHFGYEYDIPMSYEDFELNGDGHIWTCKSSRTSCMSQILREVGEQRVVFK